MSKSIFIIAGEASGDLHGSNLMKALRTLNPALSFQGVGGPLMRQQDLDCLLPMEEFEVMGFAEVLASLPKLWKQFNIKSAIRFFKSNLRLWCWLITRDSISAWLKHCEKKATKERLFNMSFPTVWAWGKHRIAYMEKSLDLLLSIFPFEPGYFAHTSLSVKYVGHPTLETIQKHPYDNNWIKKTALNSADNLIALFPGSRKRELTGHLPTLLQTAAQLKEHDPSLQFAISQAKGEYLPMIQKMVSESSLEWNRDVFLVPSAYNYELMRDCRSAIAKSGTVTLELALHHKPTAVVYAVSFLNYMIAKYWLRLQLPHFCIVNILAGKEIFPELLAKQFTASELFQKVQQMHDDSPARKLSIAECQSLKSLLGNHRASERAAQAIVELLS